MAVLSGLLPLMLLVTAGFPIEGKKYYDKYDPAEGKQYYDKYDPAEGKKYYDKYDPAEVKKYYDKYDPAEGKKYYDKYDSVEGKKYYDKYDSVEGKKYYDKYDSVEGKKYDKYDSHHHDYPPRQNYYNTEEKYQSYDQRYEPVPREHKQKVHTFISDYGPAPPPHDQVAKMARYIVHTADWAAISTHSSAAATRGFPFANIVSLSDGPINNSSGVPYMYITPLELSTQDLEVDPHCSLALSLAETDYCRKQNIDPEDPRCARVILTGKIKRIKTYTTEIEFAENALFSRHPAMRTWPQTHGFYFVKIKIEQILVLDYYGGPKIVPLPEYFNPPDAQVRQ